MSIPCMRKQPLTLRALFRPPGTIGRPFSKHWKIWVKIFFALLTRSNAQIISGGNRAKPGSSFSHMNVVNQALTRERQ